MRDHTKLRAFELADEVTVMIYRITKAFHNEEIYGLTSQMRRAAVSVSSNIVEGCALESQTEYLLS
jgi:four helix bundle protein